MLSGPSDQYLQNPRSPRNPATGLPARVLLVGPVPPPHGGISVHVATLERRLLDAGVDCRVVDLGGGAGREPLASWRRLRSLARIRRLARAGWTAHVHTNGHNPKSWLLALACARAARSAPARVLTLHSGFVPAYLAGASTTARALARRALRDYRRVVCVNAEIRDAVARIGVEGARLCVAPAYVCGAGLDETAVDPNAAAAAAALPEPIARWLADDRPRLLAVLFFRPEYGLDLLIEALARLRHRHPALGCLLLGGGEGEPEARAAVRAAGLAGCVRFGGDVEHALCRSLMARADLFVRPTRVDGDALSVREALALGVPVVASDAGFRPPGTALFSRGDAGELAERLEQVLSRPRAPKPRAASTVGGLDDLARPYSGIADGDVEGGRPWAPPCVG